MEDNNRMLIKYEDYNRKEVHDIFAPGTSFYPGAGLWGLRGIVKISNRENSFVFFVTFGRKQADHEFEEYITEDGILTWQSQPSQDLQNKTIQKLINHNHYKDNIYLFLRTDSGKNILIWGV